MTTLTASVDAIDQNSEVVEGVIEPETRDHSVSDIECLCPFCGSFNAGIGKPCSHCQLEDNTTNRAQTKQRLGPWYVLQATNPSAPGMNFETLQTLIQRQVVTSRSVVRGPTTGQLWRLASKIRGLSREFGQCYSCGGDIESHETKCPHCERIQTVPEQADIVVESTVGNAVVPETAKCVRDVLLAEPTVHIQFTTAPDSDRPVLAERSERHMPKDDLLTPHDVAKAFQLEFGLKGNQVYQEMYLPNSSGRKLKIAFTSAGALIALAMIFPMLRVVSGWINSDPVRTNRTTTVAAAPPVTEPPAIEPSATDAMVTESKPVITSHVTETPRFQTIVREIGRAHV